LFSKLAKCRGGRRSDLEIVISEKLEEGLNGDVKSITKPRYPSIQMSDVVIVSG